VSAVKTTMAGRFWILLAVLSIVALWWYVETNPLDQTALPSDPAAAVTVGQLPAEARVTLKLIERGGPYPYRQDAQVFANRERLLPGQRPGYWREYTVRTPGEDDRGPRRLVVGSGGEVFYTSDHYASFRRVIGAEVRR
jgi:ribonuclease T1